MKEQKTNSMQHLVSKKCRVNNNSCELLRWKYTSLYLSQYKQETKLKANGLKISSFGEGQDNI